MTVSLRSASGTEPGTAIAQLTNPSDLSTAGEKSFSAPANTVLSASTRYFVHAQYSLTANRPAVRSGSADGEDSGGLAGWSIDDERRHIDSGAWVSSSFSLAIAVYATARTTPDTPDTPDTPNPPSTTNPDLVVDPPSLSESSPVAGAAFTLSTAVRNRGAGRSRSTRLHYYRSTNATISASDTRLGSDPVAALSPSGTSAESIELTAPTAVGSYHYGACVDAVSGESDTTNNCSTSVQVDIRVEAVPALPPLGQLLLALGLAALGVRRTARRGRN